MEKFSKKSTKERERKQKKKQLNYVQLHKINKSSSYTTNCIQGCMKKRKQKYTIESVLTSHIESCTAYLRTDERTGPV